MTNWNKDKALRFVLDYLRGKYYGSVEIKERNQFGDAYITTNKGNFYFKFKRDLFHSFPYEFPIYQQEKNHLGGAGESINEEYLEFAINKKCELLFCYQQYPNAIYTPSRQKLLSILESVCPHEKFIGRPTVVLLKIFCTFYNLMRVQNEPIELKVNDYCGGTVVKHETTFSFPFKIMGRLNQRF